MRTTYKVLAYLIAAAVAVQAAAMAFVVAGMFTWIAEDGGVLDAATLENPDGLNFPEIVGFVVHGMNGMFVIPALALIMLVVSFFARVPRGILWAGLLLALIVVQVLLGIARTPGTAGLHGLNALFVFAVALVAGYAARARNTVGTPVSGTDRAPVA